MRQYLLADGQDVLAQLVHREIQRHRVGAEQVDHFFVDISKISIGGEPLVDLSLLVLPRSHHFHGVTHTLPSRAALRACIPPFSADGRYGAATALLAPGRPDDSKEHLLEDLERSLFFEDAAAGRLDLLRATEDVLLRRLGISSCWLRVAGYDLLEVLFGVDEVQYHEHGFDYDAAQLRVRLFVRSTAAACVLVLNQRLLEEVRQALQLWIAKFVQFQLFLNEHLLHIDHGVLHNLQVGFLAD